MRLLRLLLALPLFAAGAIFSDPSLHVPRQPYYRDPRIHNLGDTAFHAGIARPVTRLVDRFAYGGEDVRRSLLSCVYRHHNLSVIDMCCGTGASTGATGVGIDTSEHVIREARWRRGRHGTFIVANAESYGEADSFDVATLVFCLHEMPRGARNRVIQNANRVARKRVFILDIGTLYAPSRAMLAGEPYLEEYQSQILQDVAPFQPVIHNVVDGRLLLVEMTPPAQRA